jgi:predicted nucleotidyltransferase
MAKVNLYPDFREFLESLNSAGVRYLVVGGYAVIHYGYPRTTNDLDVWIAADPANARRVSRVLQQFAGFPSGRVKPSMFQALGKVFIFGREPVRIDLLTGPDGVDFDQAYARRLVVNWDGVDVPLISLEDLKKNKAASGRAKDLADLDALPPARKTEQRRKRRSH